MYQIIDNSTLLEAGEFLIGIRKFDNNDIEALERRVENLLILLHALLVGDKIKHSALKVDRNNKGVKYLLEETITSSIIEPLNWTWADENELLSFVRKKIKKEIEEGVLQPIILNLNQNIDLAKLVIDEIKTYLIPEGLNHYWNNIGFENGESEEAQNLYALFEKLFSFTLNKLENQDKSIHEQILDFINTTLTNKDDITVISRFYWLGFLSNVVRAEYYINLARVNKAIYSPLATRRILIEELIKDDNKEDVYILKDDERTESLFLAFQYILHESNWQREDFLDTVIRLKKQNDGIISQLSVLLLKIIELDRTSDDMDSKSEDLKLDLLNIEKEIKAIVNQRESTKTDRIYTRLSNDFFEKWL